jgi:hypothetical protein
MPLASHCGRHWSYHAIETDFPHPGFFLLCQELGLYQGGETGADAAQFHQTMLAALMPR